MKEVQIMSRNSDEYLKTDDMEDAIDSYFECLTECSLSGEGVECVTQCVTTYLKEEQ